jgi:hypothetical protein
MDPYRTLVEKEVELKRYGQEIGIVSFKVSETNSIYDVDEYSGGIVVQELQNQYNQHRDTRAP